MVSLNDRKWARYWGRNATEYSSEFRIVYLLSGSGWCKADGELHTSPTGEKWEIFRPIEHSIISQWGSTSLYSEDASVIGAHWTNAQYSTLNSVQTELTLHTLLSSEQHASSRMCKATRELQVNCAERKKNCLTYEKVGALKYLRRYTLKIDVEILMSSNFKFQK